MPIEVKVSRPGLVILEILLDTVWVDNQQQIRSEPVLEISQTSGFPVLQQITDILVGVPSNATIQLFHGDVYEISGYTPVIASPEKAKGIDLQLPTAVWTNNHFPSQQVFLTPIAAIRGYPSSRLVVFPIQFSNGSLLWNRQLTIQINWDPVDRAFNPRLLSRTSLKQLRPHRRGKTLESAHSIPKYHFYDNIVRITVDSTGWYVLTRSELADSGISINTIDPRTFRLWNKDNEILLFVEGEEDGTFNSGDRIIFYGEKNPPPAGAPYYNNFYTDDNIYWLAWNGENGIRYLSESAYPNSPSDQVLRPNNYAITEHIERDEYFARLGHLNTHQRWDTFDHFFMNPPIHAGTSVDFEVSLPNPKISNTLEFEILLEIQGITTSTRNIQFLINNHLVGGATWAGQQLHHLTGSQGQDILQSGINTVTILNLEETDESNRYDQVYLNWLNVTYQRLFKADDDRIEFTRDENIAWITQFEVSGFSSPEIYIFKEGVSRLRDFLVEYDTQEHAYTAIFQDFIGTDAPVYHALTNDRLRHVKQLVLMEPVSTNLNEGSSPYVVICPDSFRTVLEPLVEYHNGTIIDIDEIYRQYSGGVLSPYAIKEFLTDVYRSWSPRPDAVLIAMQGNWFGWSGGFRAVANYIPVMRIQTYGFGAVSSDFWYTCVEGDDLIPEFAIGRFPAKNQSELEIMVEKTVLYLNHNSESWQNNILLIGGYESTFKDQSETLIQQSVQQGFFANRLYVDRYSEGSPFFGNTDSLLQYLHRGLSYLNFLGHGGGAVWGDRSLFTLGDLERLENGYKLPFVTSMTCFTGDVTNPSSLGRKIITGENGGAIAWFGSSGVGWIINDFLLLQPLNALIFSGETISIGEMINRAKVQYIVTNTAYPDIAISQIHQFNLTGDPALLLHMPIFQKAEVSPIDPEPGETVNLTIIPSEADSVFIQIYNPELIPLPRQPVLLNSNAPIEYDLPDELVSGLHRMNVSYQVRNELRNSSIPFMVSGSLLQIVSIIPQNPTAQDSIWIRAIAQDRQGIDSVQLQLNGNFETNMVPIGENLYESVNPISPQPAGTVLFVNCQAVDNGGDKTVSPEVKISITQLPNFQPTSLEFFVDNQIKLKTKVKNETIGIGNVLLEFLRIETNGIYSLGFDTLYFSGLGELMGEFQGTFPRGTHTYRVISTAENSLSNRSDDTLTSLLETPAFWVTPEFGTTEDLQSHSPVGLEGVMLEIPAGIVAQPYILYIRNLDVIDTPAPPAFTLLEFDSLRKGIEIISQDYLDYTLTWKLSEPLSEQSRLFQYFNSFDNWLEVEMDILSDSLVQFIANGSAKFAFFITDDVAPPHLEATVNGQRFLRNGYVSNSPVIAFTAQDGNGIDHRLKSIDLWLNDQVTGKEMITQVNGKANLLGIQISPTFTTLDSTLKMVVHDASGNPSDTLQLKFIVSEQLDLIDYGNYPNPFKDQTRFAYELTETVDEFNLDIYSVDGRHIRRFASASTLTDLDPRVGAYHEIIWDGRNKHGDFVSNGVYFYLMRVKKGRTVIEAKGKAAKTR